MAAQPAVLAGCANYGAIDFEIGIRLGPAPARMVTVDEITATGPVRVSSLFVSPTVFEPGTGCNWVAHVGEGRSGPLRIDLERGRLYQITMGSESYLYSLYGTNGFFSTVASGDPDLLFIGESSNPNVRLRVYPVQLGGGAQGRDVDDFFSDGRWVLPYDVPVICVETGCNADNPINYPFLTRVSAGGTYSLPVSVRAATDGDWRINRDYVWSSSDVASVDFGRGGSLMVSRSLSVSGVTLTSTDPLTRWRGLFVSGGTATLSGGATVERVGAGSQASVTVTGGGHVVLDGAKLRDSSGGLLVSGKGSTGLVTGATQITGNAGGAGILATARGSVTVASNTAVITGNAEGVAATGSGSRVLVTAAQIVFNGGPGVRAGGGGRVDVLRYTGYTPPTAGTMPVLVDNNVGGLYADAAGKTGGGVVFTGERVYECTPSGCPNPSVGNHNFTNNNSGPAFDIRSRGASVAYVPENYWGTSDPALVQRDHDVVTSTLVYEPIRTVAASATGGGLASRGPAGGPQAALDESAPAARVRPDVLALIGQAEGRVQASEGDDAAALLLSAWALADSDEDRLAVSEAAGRTLGVVEPADLIAWTTTASAWGLRSRASGLTAQGRTAEAAALAAALAATPGTGDVAEGHRIRGLSLRVETAVASGDAATAVSALSDLADADPEGAADLAVSVALAFPGAGVVAGRGIAPVRGSVPTPDAGRAESDLTLAVGPNPAAGAVRVVLGAAEQAEIAVYDALGRRVAILHDGPAGGGVTATFDGASFPAGLYVVRAVVRGAGGTAVLTRTVTVTR